ncbi:hypothetical protein RJ641_005877 [Dillenia turbinata]|uniref:GPI-anchored protein LLG1-like domain-containing protein n=1 Tax=Dillenia turbinata TaxID=194707 RepID=A0AAN8Z708_9MAGN
MSNLCIPSHSSDGIAPSGNSLLIDECPENLENWNYTIITSKCKGPHYTAKVCCDALKELACPHADILNDLTTDCSVTMFSYINLYGKYPPGLFANECKEDKDGLNCPEAPPPSPSDNGGQMSSTKSSVLMVMAGLGFLAQLC